MEHSVLIQGSNVSQFLLHFTCHCCSSLQFCIAKLLQLSMLVTEGVLPFIESVGEVRLDNLLAILNEVEPVLDNLPHVDILSPSVKHLGLQVPILVLGVHLPSAYCLLQNRVTLILSLIGYFIYLPVCETFLLHKVLHVANIHLSIQNILNYGSFEVDIHDGGGALGLILPLVESILEVSHNPVIEDSSSLAVNDSVLLHLVSVATEV